MKIHNKNKLCNDSYILYTFTKHMFYEKEGEKNLNKIKNEKSMININFI